MGGLFVDRLFFLHPSVAGGGGRLDIRAQRASERILSFERVDVLRVFLEKPLEAPLCAVFFIISGGLSIETHGGRFSFNFTCL